MSITAQEVLEKARELNVKFVRLQFTDVLGMLKNVSIPVEQLEKALEGKLMFDGSSIEGFVRIQESDMYLKPDFDTFCLFPWKPNGVAIARLICDVYTPEGEPFEGDPRYALKKVIAEAKEMGYEMYAGPEPEFFIFKLDAEGKPTVHTHDQGGYFDLSPVDMGEDIRREIVIALEQMGFEVETSHHEVAPGQHEIDFKYADALRTADNIATFKFVTKVIARNFGFHATFMPKPIFGINGSGMHVHQSLFSNGKNAFYDEAGELCLSQTAKYYIGGLLKHSKAIAAITNPIINSYKRLVPGYEAPVYISWSGKNRSALIRVPAANGVASRIEFRCPDPTANPYLALAVMLKAGLDGIKNKIDPGAQVFDNIFDMTEEERQQKGIDTLPGSLNEAIAELCKDPVISGALGEHIFKYYIRAKKLEWDEYRTKVSEWELERYLSVW